MDILTDIIYEDKDLLICHKMPGIPVQSANVGRQDMVSLLQNYLAKKGENNDIFLVHRLDQPVEGIMAFARTKKAAAAFSQQLQKKHMDKQYLALVEGTFPEATGKLEDYLLRDGKSNTSRTVPPHHKGAKFAKLYYRAEKSITETNELAAFWKRVTPAEKENIQHPPLTYLSIHLETGRHHQIRVQMAHAGHPLVGDKKYNPNSPSGYLPIGLCSAHLSFNHPTTGKRMEFTTEPKGILFLQF